MDKQSNTKHFIGNIAAVNYYNQTNRIIRVSLVTEENVTCYYDMYYMNDSVFPNPEHHIAIISADENVINNRSNQIKITDSAYNLIPGLNSKGQVTRLCNGYVWVVDKKTKISTTYHNHGDAGMFNKRSASPSDEKKLRYALTPTLPKEYTSTKDIDVDEKYDNIGVFITDDSILIKGPNSSISLGDEGTMVSGLQYSSKSRGPTGILIENPLATFFPSTIVSIPLGISHIPNYNYFIGIGTAVSIATTAISSMAKVVKIGSQIVDLAGKL